jgi:hypothetical protein
MVIHQVGCWETAAWDVEQSHITQLWRLGTHSGMRQQNQERHPEVVQQLLDCGGSHQYAFPDSSSAINTSKTPCGIPGTGWSQVLMVVWMSTETMGAEYVLGTDDPEPIISFLARVGGPLASARAEAASLLQLLLDVQQRCSCRVHLLIFVDCLVVWSS